MCGDLNALPFTLCMKLVLGGCTNPADVYEGDRSAEIKSYLAPYKNPIPFKSAYEQYNPRITGSDWKDSSLSLADRVNGHPAYSSYAPGSKILIDYILYSEKYVT